MSFHRGVWGLLSGHLQRGQIFKSYTVGFHNPTKNGVSCKKKVELLDDCDVCEAVSICSACRIVFCFCVLEGQMCSKITETHLESKSVIQLSL